MAIASQLSVAKTLKWLLQYTNQLSTAGNVKMDITSQLSAAKKR